MPNEEDVINAYIDNHSDGSNVHIAELQRRMDDDVSSLLTQRKPNRRETSHFLGCWIEAHNRLETLQRLFEAENPYDTRWLHLLHKAVDQVETVRVVGDRLRRSYPIPQDDEPVQVLPWPETEEL